MHVYLRDDPVTLRMEEVDANGLAPVGTELTPVAFFVDANPQPSFRALLPPATVGVLREALDVPVTLGVLAEEPDDPDAEVRAMVGLALPVGDLGELAESAEEEDDTEPWRASAGDPEGWRGETFGGADDEETAGTALLAFAPLVRVRRRFPQDFAEELADLLEAALAGVTRPALEARVDRFLGDL